MSKLPWLKFWWSDWLADPALKLCSLGAQGLLIRLLCMMAGNEPRGMMPTIGGKPLCDRDLARLLGIKPVRLAKLLAELDNYNILNRNGAGVIYSGRMLSEPAYSPFPILNREPVPAEIRKAVRERAQYRCEDCGERRALELHHLRYRRDGETIFGRETIDDLVGLCRVCHHARHHDPEGNFWGDPEKLAAYLAD